jgi:hypothetical protein
MLMLAISIVFLPHLPVVQAGVFLFCEIVHLLLVLWVMPFINFFNHVSTVISSILSIVLFTGFVGSGSAADPAHYSSLYVLVMLTILAQALITQMWPVLVVIGQLFVFLVMALDTTELLGGSGEEASESAQRMQRAMRTLRLVTNHNIGQSDESEVGLSDVSVDLSGDDGEQEGNI